MGNSGTAQFRPYDFSKIEEKRTALLQRNTALKTERTTWRTHWADISRHLLPRNGRFFISDRNRTGRDRYNKIYDNTATRALRTLGAGMQTGATNPARPWFNLTTADPDLGEYYPVRAWLDDVVDRMQRVFARSNTYRTLHQMYEELGAFGTAVSIVLPDFHHVIHHYPVVCGEYALQQDYQGKIIACYREFEKTVGEVVKEFGLENCSTAVKNQWNARHLENEVQILHVIEPRADQERDPHSRRAKDMPFKSCYLELGGDNDKFLRESGFKRFPVLAPRWAVAGGDVYGTSPGMEALGDIRQLQQEQLRKGQGIDYMVRPPLQVPTDYKNRATEMFPGGVNYPTPGGLLPHDQATAGGGIRSAFNVNLDLNHLLEDILDVRGRINSSFYADLFLMLASGAANTNMTATEVAERHEEKLLALGPVMERLHNELLQPLIDITFDTMSEAGLLPPPPEEIAGQELTVEFVSILAQAQRAVGSNSVDRFMGNVMEVSAVKPEVLDKINFDKWVDKTSQMLGVETDIIVDDENVLALRQARAAAEAEQARIAADREKAATAKDASSVKTDERNVVSDVLNSGAAQEVIQ
jgi:hypothetical protein